MRICHSSESTPLMVDAGVLGALESVSEELLRETVESIAIPRHFFAEARNNRLIAKWIGDRLQSYGYSVEFQGENANVIGSSPEVAEGPLILVGAHYDSVPGTPGADDNASAVAALLACAKAVADHEPRPPLLFVAFNREEDGLIGSTDFVNRHLPDRGLKIRHAHILEMVGYCRHTPGSQRVPAGLPVRIPGTGDFLGVIGNRKSNREVDAVLQRANSCTPDLPVIGLKVYGGLEKYLPVLGRSDHDPFWKAGISVSMWTDTAEFRNPNYHQPTDTPDSLDYSFLRKVSQLLLACVLPSQVQILRDHVTPTDLR